MSTTPTSAFRAVAAATALASAAFVTMDAVPTAFAAPTTFVVDTTSDDPADGDTLREAVADANANPGSDRIEFADGLAGTIDMLGGTEMVIVDSVSIVGPGSEQITIDADGASRHFASSMAGVEFSISGLTLTNGASAFNGGSINMFTGKSLTLSDVVITESNSQASGGALYVRDVDDDVTIEDSHFEGNSADGPLGGAVAILGPASAKNVDIIDTAFVGNTVVVGQGGAVLIDTMQRTVVVENATFEQNTSPGDDNGALFAYGDRVAVRSSHFANNLAGQRHGAIHAVGEVLASLSDTTVVDNTAQNGQGGAGRIESPNGDVSIGATIVGNRAESIGGMTLSAPNGEVIAANSTIHDNDAASSIGNLAVVNSQSFQLRSSTISGGNASSSPGAFISQVDSSVIDKSTVSGNVADDDAASGGAGLSVLHFGNGDLRIDQSTLSANTTLGEGGAIRTSNIDTEISYSTLVDNAAAIESGALARINASSFDIDHSILSANSAPTSPHYGEPVEIDWSIVDPLPGLPPIGGDNQFGVDPKLGGLADNGGVTFTHLPDFGSPAIDAAAPNQLWAPGSTDQRGFVRAIGKPDLGSVEVQAPVWIPVEPARIVDTRANGETADGQNEAGGPFADKEQRSITVAGRVGIPLDALGVVANVTAVGPFADGYLTVHPCADPMPVAASLNYTAGVDLGDEVIIGLASEDLCIFSFAATNITVDVVGYVPNQSPYEPIEPKRYLDTRANGITFDGDAQATGAPGAGNHIEVKLGGRGEVELDSTAMVYVAAVNAPADGFVTIWDCSGPRPLASSLNYVAGVNRGNEVIAETGPDGEVCIFTDDDIDVTVDVVGYIPEYTDFTALDTPARMLDTRTIGETVDGHFEAVGPTTADGTLMLDLAGRGDIPSDATTVSINLTAIGPGEPGFVTAYPCGDLPLAANLNYVPGVNGGNEIIAALDDAGSTCLHTSSPLHLAADVTGYTRG